MLVHPGAGFALWTGLDFVCMVNGAGLSLLAPTVPRTQKYDSVLRCKTQVSDMHAKQVDR